MTGIGRKMEPIVALTRVSHVSAGVVSEENPVIRVATRTEFEAFYDGARASVARALAVTLGDADLAGDAVDEAMVRAFQRWRRVGALENPAGWVYRVALNHSRGALRRRRHRDEHVGREAGTHPDVRWAGERTAGSVDPAIARALAALPLSQRSVVVCRLVLDWSERETADALGIKSGTVKSRLNRALAGLKVELSHYRPEDRR